MKILGNQQPSPEQGKAQRPSAEMPLGVTPEVGTT
nr:MAG TPA: hypothetical protein [Caudoviricetes sp.]